MSPLYPGSRPRIESYITRLDDPEYDLCLDNDNEKVSGYIQNLAGFAQVL